MATTTVKSREARIKWRDILDQVYAGSGDVVVERSGKPVAVIIPFIDYQEIQDKLDDLRAARQAVEAYQQWKQDPSIGKPWEQVEAELIEAGLLDE